MIGISTWCHLIIPKATPFPKDGSFPRSPATTSGQRPLSCISKDAPRLWSSHGSFQLLKTSDATIFLCCRLNHSLQTPYGIALPRSYVFLVCSVLARDASWIRRLIWFFRKGPRWTGVITTGSGLGSPNLPLFWRGLVQSDLFIYSQWPCVWWVSMLNTGVHWVDLAAFPLVLSVKAGLMQNLHNLPTQRTLWLPGGKVRNALSLVCDSWEAAGCRRGCQKSLVESSDGPAENLENLYPYQIVF